MHVDATDVGRESLVTATLLLSGQAGYRQAIVERIAASAGHTCGYLL